MDVIKVEQQPQLLREFNHLIIGQVFFFLGIISLWSLPFLILERNPLGLVIPDVNIFPPEEVLFNTSIIFSLIALNIIMIFTLLPQYLIVSKKVVYESLRAYFILGTVGGGYIGVMVITNREIATDWTIFITFLHCWLNISIISLIVMHISNYLVFRSRRVPPNLS